MSYKGNTGDDRESPAYEIISLLENKGYESMRTIYLKLGMNILARERDILNKMIAQSSKNTSIPYKKKD